MANSTSTTGTSPGSTAELDKDDQSHRPYHKVSVALAVTPGLEDYALESILARIRDTIRDLAHLQVAASLSSGYVFIRFQEREPGGTPPSLLAFVDFLTRSQGFAAVAEAFLCVADEDMEETRLQLEREFKCKLSQLSRSRKNTHNSADKSARIPGESHFLESLTQCILSSAEALEQALLIHSTTAPLARTYRGTFSNPSRLLPFTTLESQDIERRIGELIHQFLPSMRSPSSAHAQTSSSWKVQLKDPDLELLSIAAQRRERILVLSADRDTHNIQTISETIRSRPPLAQACIEGMIWNANGTGGGLRCGTVDGVVTDLPYGHRELSFSALQSLYPRFLANIARLCKEGSYAVLMTEARPLLKRCIEKNPAWALVPMGNFGTSEGEGRPLEREVFIGGLRAYVFLLQRQKV
ncbi:hypothetical protein BOTBODRAFT_169633 [Botryobasidium botryosum FD-172 SS1]|uniref:Ribosomal RNA large subunit methyltransferase K/L-like methyltransferase domain-containing protein n=1 Tax=Botryobasidium botryosum (strain FD-172 SS1) TaxID=930990 RepID=A0A067MYX3_BOTB1|nr:hypothetical protein BOTBODRAFT_169633 [Botryobasidium botryosum FD-172 SS1]